MTDTVPYGFPHSEELAKCPYSAYARLRENEPVFRAEGGEYVVSRYSDVLDVLRDGVRFRTPETRSGHPIQNMNELEDPEHKRRRLLLARAFARGRLEAFRPMIARYANSLIDGLERDEAEFMNDFANPLPVMVISGLVGIAEADFGWMFAWARGFEGAASEYIPPDQRDAYLDRTAFLHDFLERELKARLVEPRDDLLSELIAAKREELAGAELAGEPLDALNADMRALVGGAIHNTTYMLANSMLLLLQEPERMDAVRDDRRLIKSVLEEAMRLESPVQWQPRIAKCDTTIVGVDIPAGAKVIVLLGAANRDPARFPEADQFDLTRSGIRGHIAFGFGSYACIGAPLARLEGEVAMETLLQRFRRIELTDAGWEASTHCEFRGPMRLPVKIERT